MRSKISLTYLFIAAVACTTSKSTPGDSASMASDDSMSAAARSDDNAGRQTIEKLRSSWKEGSDRKDSTAVAALYTDDAVFVGTDAPAANGRGAIEKTLGRGIATSTLQSIDSKDLVVSGNEAYDFGTFTQQVTRNGKPVTVTGYYLVTLRKQPDGSWKIFRHVSTTPPATP
ncbi:MAG: SgcJ/EcaC family oxidoreductase [Gemmatimonadales bacterium]